ncbi:MAG: ParB/RepB/Spo0J family partition protein [Phycisphaerales bacterium]
MSETNPAEAIEGADRSPKPVGGKATRRLGRGLSALLGPAAKPVRVDVPRGTPSEDPRRASSTNGPDSGGQPPDALHLGITDEESGSASEPIHSPAVAPSPKISTPVAEVANEGDAERLVFLRPSEVTRNPHQPRERFDEAAMKTLVESIRTNGLMQPIVVRPVAGGFELVAGERRLRAANVLGLEQIPAVVKRLDNRQSAEWALIENLQREDLNPLERAKGIDRLIREFTLSHQQAAERVGLERASVSNLLRLLELDPGTASLVARGDLGQGHAKVLLSVADVGLRTSLAQNVIDRQWSVRRLEAEVRRLIAPASLPPASTMPRGKQRSRTQLDDLERRLSEHLGTRVQILVGRQKGQGRLVIDFHGLEHFDGLMERMGFQAD